MIQVSDKIIIVLSYANLEKPTFHWCFGTTCRWGCIDPNQPNGVGGRVTVIPNNSL